MKLELNEEERQKAQEWREKKIAEGGQFSSQFTKISEQRRKMKGEKLCCEKDCNAEYTHAEYLDICGHLYIVALCERHAEKWNENGGWMSRINNSNFSGLCIEQYCDTPPTETRLLELYSLIIVISLCSKHNLKWGIDENDN